LSATVTPLSNVRDLGIFLDSQLSISDQVTSLCRAGYYQLRQLRTITQSLTPDAATTLVHSFISGRLDYCNSLLYGIADHHMKRLQSVQNAAARLVTCTRRSEHITLVLQSLHWLPVHQRVAYKMAMLVHKCLNGRAPAYLADDLCWAGRRRPGSRSADRCVLDVPRVCSSFGDRTFAVAGPRVWNDLPQSLRDPSLSESVFGKRLKTYLMGLGAH